MGAALLLLLAACGPPPEFESELKTAGSWTATAHLAAEERRAGATSARYTAQVRDRALEARQQTAATFATLAGSAGERSQAAAALDSMDAARRELDALVGAP